MTPLNERRFISSVVFLRFLATVSEIAQNGLITEPAGYGFFVLICDGEQEIYRAGNNITIPFCMYVLKQ